MAPSTKILPVEEELLKGVRKVRNIEFDPTDLKTLLNGDKSPASIIDAYFGLVQARAELKGVDLDWCIFSSCLGPLIAGEKPEGRVYGTIEDHILAACSAPATPEALLGKTKWIVPLCGGRPSHWILAWVNFSSVSALSLRVYLPLGVMNNQDDEDDPMDQSDGSGSDIPSSASLLFSCRSNQSSPSQIHTYSSISLLLYNLGMSALVIDPLTSHRSLTPLASKRWLTLNKPQVRKVLPTIRIPGGRMRAKA
ncbi:hypothetical protein BDZ94DRAFT_1327210 [Collybia nuda]|uniref:Ubiquitin-like protease family profile domain-containing protein n=1 Tax=Collybia nuda TaxID=64659 RepID=A0A9P6C8K7_9AGAR|nr:hypothetical protein BDZ94DRAFT_1327210 [Collybia nuda]